MKDRVYILGIYDGHLATATLLKNGQIVGSVSEERFTGIKNYSGFPYKSIDYLLKMEGISGKDLEMVVIPQKWGVPVFSDPKVQKSDRLLSFSVAFYRPLGVLRNIWGIIEYRYPSLSKIRRPLYELAFKIIGGRTIKKHKDYIAKHLKIDVGKIRSYEHHLAHAAAAYYESPYNKKDALVLTIDGEGDLISASVNTVRKGKIKRLASTPSDSSLGWIYYEITGFLGMRRNEHEYKVMGLAPYAKEYGVLPLFEKIKDLVTIDPKNQLRFRSKFDTHLMRLFTRRELQEQRFDYVAGAFQKLVEDRVSEWARNAIKKTGLTTVCLGGGVAMNVKANLKVAELPEVKEFFVSPSAGDETTPAGACYLGYIDYCKENKIEPQIVPVGPLYLGPGFDNADIEKFLRKGRYLRKYKIRFHRNIEKVIAKLLAKGKVVGRLSGRMEWGARALGNRSILADPSNPDIVRIINEQMKMRDFWMPFTPSILAERKKDYVVNPKNIPAPYMILTFHSTELARKHLKAAMHPYDFTLRPQVVEQSWNREYHKIIREFEKITGIGAVLNTSFNLHGYPIVLGPKEAMHAFENSDLEYVALGNHLVSKK